MNFPKAGQAAAANIVRGADSVRHTNRGGSAAEVRGIQAIELKVHVIQHPLSLEVGPSEAALVNQD